jgi:hypothetical protein
MKPLLALFLTFTTMLAAEQASGLTNTDIHKLGAVGQ